MFKVLNKDNIFLKNMYIVSISEKDRMNNKIITAGYKATCRICKFTVTSIEEINVKKAIIAHIISMHRDIWINHEPELTEVNE